MATQTAKEKRKDKLGSISSLMNKVKPKNDEATGTELKIKLTELEVGKYQPRRNFDETALSELAASIKAQGVIQPIVVRKTESGYEVLAGERRWRASEIAGKKDIPAILKDVDDQTAIAIALIENIQREDLDYMEEANSIQQLKTEFKLKNKEVAQTLGKSEKEISLLLGLLNLPDLLKALYDNGTTSPQILAVLVRCLKLNESKTTEFINQHESLTYAQVVAFQKMLKNPDSGQEDKPPTEDDNQSGEPKATKKPSSSEPKELEGSTSEPGSTFDNQNVIVFVEHLGDQWQLDLARKDDDAEFCWIKSGSDTLRVEAKELTVKAVQ